jgi:hypothetical protein
VTVSRDIERAAAEAGRLFGEHDYRRLLREAATRAGSDKHRAEAISGYYLRHLRLTHLGR